MAENLQRGREAWGDGPPELYYLSVGSMTVMINMDDDMQATDRDYDKWKRGLMSGIGGTIVEKPSVRKETDD